MARTNQGGSIVGFVVIGAVLILGSAGLLYWVSHRDAPATKTPEVSVPAASENSDKEKTETPTNSDSDTNKEETDNTQTSETPSQPTSSSSDQAVEQIPQTGPADTLMQLLAIGLLAGVVAVFVRSHKHRSTL